MPGHPTFSIRTESLRGPVSPFCRIPLRGCRYCCCVGALSICGRVERWGDPKSLGGGAVSITPVYKIPLPAREGVINHVANDTESQIPAPPKPEPKQVLKPPEPDAIAIKEQTSKKQKPERASPQHYTTCAGPEAESAVQPHWSGADLADVRVRRPAEAESARVQHQPVRSRFGWYEQLLRERVAQNWRSQDLDSRLRNRVAVMFDIQRDGTIRQRSRFRSRAAISPWISPHSAPFSCPIRCPRSPVNSSAT